MRKSKVTVDYELYDVKKEKEKIESKYKWNISYIWCQIEGWYLGLINGNCRWLKLCTLILILKG